MLIGRNCALVHSFSDPIRDIAMPALALATDSKCYILHLLIGVYSLQSNRLS
jgi:hypothetical protein